MKNTCTYPFDNSCWSANLGYKAFNFLAVIEDLRFRTGIPRGLFSLPELVQYVFLISFLYYYYSMETYITLIS